MSEQTVNGIVLRKTDLGESDRKITLLTSELGKISVVAKGARKGASRLGSSTDLFAAGAYSIATGKRTAYVTQVQPMSSFTPLRRDFARLNLAMSVLELFDAMVPVEQPDGDAYELLFQSLSRLADHERPLVAAVWSQVALLHWSGLLPQFSECAVCDAPAATAEGYLSPAAGGFLCPLHAFDHSDRFVVRHEVLIGLSRIGLLSSPPANLKFADLSLVTLMPFWRTFAESRLPVNESWLRQLQSDRLMAE